MSTGHLSRETGHQTDQESRSAGPGATTSMTVMGITIHASFLPHNEPDASLAFDRDTLGFEVRNDVGYGGMRWITVGPRTSPYGVRDCAVRDPAGSLIRIQELG